MAPGDSGRPAQLLPQDSRLLGLTLVLGRDTIPLDDWAFTASAECAGRQRPDAAPAQRPPEARSSVELDLHLRARRLPDRGERAG